MIKGRRQLYFSGFASVDDGIDRTKWEMIQFRVSPAMKEKFQQWCLGHHVKMSEILCWVIRGILSNRQTFPGYQTNPMDELSTACDDVKKVVLTIEKGNKNDDF